MKTKLALSAVVAAVAVFSQGAFAQASAPVTRAEVKAQAKTGSLAPAGQGIVASEPSTKSDKTRMERKDTTKSDIKAGATKPAGEGAELKNDKKDKAQGTDKTRQERKDQTKADIKAGATQPAGEAANPISVAPKK